MGAPTQKSVTFRPQLGGGSRSLYGHVVALGKNMLTVRSVPRIYSLLLSAIFLYIEYYTAYSGKFGSNRANARAATARHSV
jgi:hypothetical protein